MPFGAGKDSAVKIDNHNGVLVDISQYVTSVNPSHEIAQLDVTTLGKGAHVFINGLTDSKISLEGVYEPALGTILFGATGTFGTATATRTVEWYPQGTASGKVKWTGEANVASFEVPSGVEDAVTWSAEVQMTDAVTIGTA